MSWLMKLAAGAGVTVGALAIATLMFALHQQWLVVYVESPKDLCMPLVIPVPVSALTTAARFIPEMEEDLDLSKDFHKDLPIEPEKLVALIQALRDCPDTDFVRVTTPTEKVLIRKDGNRLKILVDTGQEHVSVEVPFEFLEESMKSLGRDKVTPADLADCLAYARYTPLVQVDTPDQKVRIWSW